MSGVSFTTDQLVGWIVVFLGGGAASKLIERVFKRKDDALREPAEMTRASAELSEALSDGSQTLLNEFRKEFKWQRGRIVELQAEIDAAKRESEQARLDSEHARRDSEQARRESELATAACAEATSHRVQCEADLKDLNEKHDLLQKQIDELMEMSGPVATYTQLHRHPKKEP